MIKGTRFVAAPGGNGLCGGGIPSFIGFRMLAKILR